MTLTALHARIAASLLCLTAACTSPVPATSEHTTAAASTPDLAIWIPASSPTTAQAVQGRDALTSSGVRVYLELPGNVLVTSASIDAPANTTFEPLSTSRSWATRATAVQRQSIALAQALLHPVGPATHEPDIRDQAFPIELEIDGVRSALTAERRVTRDLVRLREIDAQLAALDAETAALAPVPLAGTPADSRRKYLRGSILVYCLFVESAAGAGQESWLAGEYEAELASYATALVGLARVAPVEYRLSFKLMHVPPTHSAMRIQHEPTDGVDERTWIVEVLRNLGYSGVVTAAGSTQRLERDLIDAHGTRDGTVVYVARDAVAPFAQSADSTHTAWPHAYFNGYAVTNSSRGGGTLLHELLHTFNADDEYPDAANCTAGSSVGHDRAVAAGSGANSNANSVDCQPFNDHQNCLMLSSSALLTAPFDRPPLCWHTRAQIGWRDTAAVEVTLTGLPSLVPADFSPSLATHIDNRVAPLGRTFSYVESGGFLYGGVRCPTHSSTQDRYTTTGDVINCTQVSYQNGTVDGRPDDIAAVPGLSTTDEGRVRRFSVPYRITTEVSCGDGTCDLTEDASSCSADCVCGNDVCDGDENLVSCPGDCAFCGDDACSPGETRYNCEVDCCTTCL